MGEGSHLEGPLRGGLPFFGGEGEGLRGDLFWGGSHGSPWGAEGGRGLPFLEGGVPSEERGSPF